MSSSDAKIDIGVLLVIGDRQLLPNLDISYGKNFLKELRIVKVISTSGPTGVIDPRHWLHQSTLVAVLIS